MLAGSKSFRAIPLTHSLRYPRPRKVTPSCRFTVWYIIFQYHFICNSIFIPIKALWSKNWSLRNLFYWGKLKFGKSSNFLTKLSKCPNSYFKASVNLTLVKRCSAYLTLSPSFLWCSQLRDLISWTQCHPPPPHPFSSSPWHCLCLPFIWFLCHTYMTHQSTSGEECDLCLLVPLLF